MEYIHENQGTCSSYVKFSLDGDVVHNIEFYGGCNGNLKAIATLCEGMTVDEIEEKLLGNTCGPRPTSCADQFARGVREAYEKSKNA